MKQKKKNIWLKAYIDYFNTGVVEKCPVCNGSRCVNVEVLNYSRTSYTFICSKCKAWDHVDGVLYDKQ